MVPRVYCDFNRGLLKEVHREVKAKYPNVDLRRVAAIRQFDGQYFVEGRVEGSTFVRWTGRAEDAAHAKYKAWSEFLSSRKA